MTVIFIHLTFHFLHVRKLLIADIFAFSFVDVTLKYIFTIIILRQLTFSDQKISDLIKNINIGKKS